VKRTLQAVEVVTPEQAAERALPEEVQLSLAEIAGAAKEGLLALAVGTGLAVLQEAMEHEVTELAGPKGRHDAARAAYRHGHAGGEVTLGGRRVPVARPRARASDGSGELGLATYRHFAAEDPLSRVVLERMLAGVSARRYARTQEPVGEPVEAAARSTSKSAVSRRVVERTREALEELMSRRLDEIELAALMIDGLDLDERCNVVALGITRDGTKVPLGLWEGSTENATVASALLADLQDRGLDVSAGVLVVIDGAKALAKAVRQVLGAGAVVQRCQRHKERNVMDHLPERERPWVRRKLRAAWEDPDHRAALAALEALARQLEAAHPGAAGSLREGLADTLTVTRLGLRGRLKATLASTNPCESMIEIVRRTQRNVKRWRSGEMRLRWTAAGMLEAEKQFRRIRGHRELPLLLAALHREVAVAEDTNTVRAV
jgi:putative transposase